MIPSTYIHHIEKELLQSYPVVGFEGEVVVVDRPEMVADAVAYLRTQPVLGVDTEARPSFTRGVHYPTALVQVSSQERCYLFRLTHIEMPQELCDIFADKNICKVGLAFRDDLRGLQRRRNFTPRNCVDLQDIACKYGILDKGLQKMFAICFERKISKAQQLTNWENTQLTPDQARYASTDAWATLLIYIDLMKHDPLPHKEVEALKAADLEKMQQHQQEVIAAREATKSTTDTPATPVEPAAPVESAAPAKKPAAKHKKKVTRKKKSNDNNSTKTA